MQFIYPETLQSAAIIN